MLWRPLRAVARDLDVTAPALYTYVHDRYDLLAAVEERVDDVIELLFRSLALQELEVVDQQHLNVAEAFLECQRIR